MTQAGAKYRRRTIELAEQVGYAYREYAHYTLLDRAIANVRDGFRPVHRRIVYAMGGVGLGPSSGHRSCARVVGEVPIKYHPHGDQSVYNALTRMGQAFSQRDVLIDGQGSFGSIDGDSPAAMRYTEKVLLVTSRGRAWLAPVGLVPEEETWSGLGLGRVERIVHLDVPEPASYLVLGTALGRLKRASLSVLVAELLDSAWGKAIGLTKNDEVVFGGTCGEEGQVLLFTGSRALRTTVEGISDQKTLSARGVAGIKLDRRDSVVGGAVIEETKRREAFIPGEKGYLKRPPLTGSPCRDGKATGATPSPPLTRLPPHSGSRSPGDG